MTLTVMLATALAVVVFLVVVGLFAKPKRRLVPITSDPGPWFNWTNWGQQHNIALMTLARRGGDWFMVVHHESGADIFETDRHGNPRQWSRNTVTAHHAVPHSIAQNSKNWERMIEQWQELKAFIPEEDADE